MQELLVNDTTGWVYLYLSGGGGDRDDNDATTPVPAPTTASNFSQGGGLVYMAPAALSLTQNARQGHFI